MKNNPLPSESKHERRLEVRRSPEFDRELAKLRDRVAGNDGEAKYLLEIIEKGLAKLESDLEAGKHIPKKQVPRGYVQKYGVTNLWKLNLDSYWRLIYTLTGDQVTLYLIVLEVLDHKKYDRKFGYHS